MGTEHDHSPAPGNFPLFFHMNRGMRSIAIGREKGRGARGRDEREEVGKSGAVCPRRMNENPILAC